MNEFFQCAVCFENFDTKVRVPRLLPCQHNFCSTCLPKLLAHSNRLYDLYAFRKDYSGYIECPICRFRHYTKLDDIPKSRLIINLLEITQGSHGNIHALLNKNQVKLLQKSQQTQHDPLQQSHQQQKPIEISVSKRTPIKVVSTPPPPPPSTNHHQQHTSSNSSSPITIESLRERILPTPPPLPPPRQQSQTPTQVPIHTQTQQQQQPQQQPQQPQLSSVTHTVYIPSIGTNTNVVRAVPSNTNINTRRESISRHTSGSPPSLIGNHNHHHNHHHNHTRSNRSQSVITPRNIENITPQTIIPITTNIQHQIKQSAIDMKLHGYLKSLFEDMDVNKDGNICFDELQEGLRRGQLNSEFNVKTVQLLFEKYDTNKDGEIDFDGFFSLYTYLNNEYCSFLMIDKDCNGTLDADELQCAFSKRGYRFNKEFYHFIENTMRETNKNGITFDNYCRLVARFDHLCHLYATTPRYQNNHTLEGYLKKTFFYNFW